MSPPAVPSLHEQKVSKYANLQKKYLNSLQTTFQLIDDPTKIKEFLSRADKVDSVYTSFESAEIELIELNSTLSDPSTHAPLKGDEADNYYYAILAHADEIRPQENAHPTSTPTSIVQTLPGNTTPKIPKIHIETFSGAVEQFSSFKSLFDTLIHSSSLSEIEKFSYLLSLLKGRALNSIKSIEFNGNNYQRAYQKLCEEYSNPRLVATHYLNKILGTKPQTMESPQALRQFLDGFFIDTEAITDLNLDNLADFMFLHLALKNLPIETRRLFEHELTSLNRIPTLNDLMSFIKKRLTVLEISPPDFRKPALAVLPRAFITTDSKFDKNDSYGNTSRPYSTCPICKLNHRIHLCAKFTGMSPEQRRHAVGNARLCYACLGPHLLSQCKTTYSCRICHNKSHHTLLHQATIPKTDKKPESSTSLTCQQPTSSTTVLLGTATAQVQCASGLWHHVRILIDPGSMVNFVTNSLAQSLNLPKSDTHSHVTGLGHTPVPTLQSAVKFANLAKRKCPLTTD
ncbi:hypothetical protein WDU94_012306 [Cyamophila willieti]